MDAVARMILGSLFNFALIMQEMLLRASVLIWNEIPIWRSINGTPNQSESKGSCMCVWAHVFIFMHKWGPFFCPPEIEF